MFSFVNKTFMREGKMDNRFFQGDILGSVPVGRWRRGHFSRPGLFLGYTGDGENNVSPIFHLTNRWRGVTWGQSEGDKERRMWRGGGIEGTGAHPLCITLSSEGGDGATGAAQHSQQRPISSGNMAISSRQLLYKLQRWIKNVLRSTGSESESESLDCIQLCLGQ